VNVADPPDDGFRWTGGAYLLLGTGAALLLTGVALRLATPVFVALPLLIAPIAAALAGPRGTLRARLEWQALGAGAEVTVGGVVRAPAGSDLVDVLLEFSTPSDLVEIAAPEVRTRGDTIRFVLRWRAPYPTVALAEPPTIRWRDPVGLVERTVHAEGQRLQIDRYPAELLRLGTVRLDRVLALPGETRSRRIGSAGEFFGIREAEPDDPRRRINWRASARAGRLLVNEYELDRTGDVLILLDARSTRLGPTVDEVVLGASRAAAIGLLESFGREKARIGFAAFGEFIDPVRLGSGRGHRLRVREAIRSTRPSPVAGPSERCAATMPRFFAPGVTTVLISSLTGDAEAELIVYLRRRGYPTIVLSPSPTQIRWGGDRLTAEDEPIADRLERLERRQRLAKVWVHAPVVDWNDFWSLGGFVRLLRGPGRRRNV